MSAPVATGPSWCAAAPEHIRCTDLGHRSPILRVPPHVTAVQLVEARAAGSARPLMVYLEIAVGGDKLMFLVTLDVAGQVRDALAQVTTWAGEAA